MSKKKKYDEKKYDEEKHDEEKHDEEDYDLDRVNFECYVDWSIEESEPNHITTALIALADDDIDHAQYQLIHNQISSYGHSLTNDAKMLAKQLKKIAEVWPEFSEAVKIARKLTIRLCEVMGR